MVGGYGGDHLDFQGAVFNGPVTGRAEYHRPAPTALDALPARAVGFTGRERELRVLLDAFDPSVSGGGPEAVLIAAVSGLGGIGKTALAVETGYAACEQGWFPGGVLFVDLHGYDDEPVTADQALEALLRALGTEPEHIPAAADQRAGLFRSVLAEHGKERGAVLIVADNASSPEQVRPLLPGRGARHRVLVTSRDRLPQLGARLLPLEQLTPKEAYDLLDRAVRIADPADSRVADEPEAAADLAARCGHLPLALQIAVALLVLDQNKPMAELAAELSQLRERLVHLDDGERSVRAAFDLSYRRLSHEQARLLRLLALAPGAEMTADVVSALAGENALTTGALDALARAHLLERGSTRGRWRMHDLVRAFGVGVVEGDAALREEGEEARVRVLEFYLVHADAANEHLRWLPGRSLPMTFADRAEALAWLDRERAGLVAAVQWGGEERFASGAVDLADYLGMYLEWGRHFDDWIVISRAAQRAAQSLGDRRGEGLAWNSLGIALRGAGQVTEAIYAHTRARDLYQAAGDRQHEAFAWNNLGFALRMANQGAEAIHAHTRARNLFQAVETRRGEAFAWNSLGVALRKSGLIEAAIDAHTQARDLYHAAGDRHREASAWNNLGIAMRKAGRTADAITFYSKAVDVYREFEDWYGLARTLKNLAFAHWMAHQPAEARTAYLQAADSFTRADAPDEADQARIKAESVDDKAQQRPSVPPIP